MITLATDFGEPYPAAMKGVIARRTDADTVDIGHEFRRQAPREAAFWLRFVLPEFPPAIHCAVIDPGVGTDRQALVVRVGDHALVGPDNGLLLPPARALADDDADIEVFAVRVEEPASNTFHGRDVFAPVAADCHEVGVERLDRLPALVRTREYEEVRLPDPAVSGSEATGEVLAVDGFGNVVTNLPGELLDGRNSVIVDGHDYPVVPAYAHTDVGAALVTVGSHERVELAVNQGRGDDRFGVETGDEIRLAWE